jgi:hypothetical protein
MKEKRVVPKVRAVGCGLGRGLTLRALAGWRGTAFVLAVERSR